MAVTYKGIATVWGLDGTCTVGGAAAYADLTGAEYGDEAAVDELKDGQGKVKGFAVRDPRKTLTIDWFPHADTIAHARTGQVSFPTIPSKVTVTIADLSLSSSAFVYKGGAKASLTADGEGKFTLPLTKYETDSDTLCGTTS